MSTVIALTGGIASGKSTVAQLLKTHGAEIIDADQLAREVVTPGSPGLAAVVDRFGAQVLRADGALDREALASIVFTDTAAREALNGILHPRIAAASAQAIGEALGRGAPLVVYEAALLVENGSYAQFPALVVVSAPREVQLARLVTDRGMAPAEAEARLDAQLPLADKEAVATHVIRNTGSLDALRDAVATLYQELVA